MDRIKELEAEIQRIKEAEAEIRKAKYQYLVGKCLHRENRVYEKIIAIDRVEADFLGDEIMYDCVRVIFNNRGDEYNSDAGIHLCKYGIVYADHVDKDIISSDVFNKAFDACVDFITRKYICKEEITDKLLSNLNLRQCLDVPPIHFTKFNETGDCCKGITT